MIDMPQSQSHQIPDKAVCIVNDVGKNIQSIWSQPYTGIGK